MQDSAFAALDSSEIESNRYFPLSVFFDPLLFMKASQNLSEEKLDQIVKVQEKFKEFMMTVEEIETDDKNKVAIVFERINRAGITLDTYQLISAWTWSSEFDFQDEIESLSEDLSSFGFGNFSENKDLILKCCSAVVNGQASPQSIISMKGTEIRDNFNKIKNGITGAIDFVKNELFVETYDWMPYPAMLVSLSCFYATDRVSGQPISDNQRKQLIKWFWKSCYSLRYTNGVTNKHETDIREIEKLKANPSIEIANFNVNLSGNFFLDKNFTMNTINTKIFVLTMASNHPRSFISGNNVTLRESLKLVNRNEFHHIFPRNHLKVKGYSNRDINCLVNLCFLSNADNQKIKDKSPTEYKNLLPQEEIANIMKTNLCPENTLDLDYSDFLEKRSELLVKYVKTRLIT